MKLYTLRGTIAGQYVTPNKMFRSREEAVEYMFKYSEKKYVFDMQVEEIIKTNGDKHNLEYVCNNNNRFFIERVIA